MQTFSLLSNCFVCLETILSLINPIAPVSKRLRIYTILTILASIAMIVFVLIFEKILPSNSPQSVKEMIKRIFCYQIPV